MDGKQLKNSILQWAIQGKLVEQNPKDEPAQKLLERIAASRNGDVSPWSEAIGSSKNSKKSLSTSLRGAKATKQSKNPTSRIYCENGVWYEQVGAAAPKDISDEIPFEIPENWAWCRLGNLIKISSGDGLVSKDMKKGDIPVFGGNGITGYHTEANVFEETVVIGRVGFYCGSVHVTPSKAWVTDNAFITDYPKNDINREFLVYCLKFLDLGKSHNATAQPVVSGKKIYPLLFPLPPLAEQKRIVAKLEQVLPLAEEYGAVQEQLNKLNKELLEALKKSVLQEAIQGKLVPQSPKDGCGKDLAKKLIEAKKILISCGKVPNKAETKPFFTQEDLDAMPIPENWCWVQLSNVSIIQEGAGIRKNQYRNSGTQILCVTNILEGKVDLEKKQLFISTDEYLEKYKHLTLNHGDIVTSCSGGSWGKTARFYAEKTMMLNTSTLRLRFFDDLADNNYLYYLCKTPFFKKQLEQQLSGMQPNFGYAHYSRIMIPLPPLAEQKRIVAKLEQLFKVL